MVSELVKCCSRRMFRFEAVLVVDRRYVIGDVGEDDFFKEFGCWGQEGNGSILEPWWGSLFGLGIGIIFANFQIWGMIFLLRDRFSIFVR